MGSGFRKIEDKVADTFRPINKSISSNIPGFLKPFIGPAASILIPGGAGIMSAFGKGFLANLLASEATSEGQKTNLIKPLISGAAKGIGAFGRTPNTDLSGMSPGEINARFGKKSFLDKIGSEAKGIASKVGDFVDPQFSSAEGEILSSVGNIGKAVGTQGAVGASIDVYEAAKKAQRDYQNANPDSGGYNSAEYTSYLKSYLANAGYSQNEIDDYMANRPSYNMGGRVAFGDGGTNNRESSGIIEMEMIDPETGQKKQFFGSLYDEEILKGIRDNSITPLESHPLLEGMKKGGRVGLAFGGDLGDPGDPYNDRYILQERDDELSTEEILQILKDGVAMGGPRLPMDIDDLESDDLETMDEFEEDQGRTFAGGPKSLLDPKEMQVASNSDESFPGLQQLIDRIRFLDTDDKMKNYNNAQGKTKPKYFEKGGIASLEMGGMPSMEMDYRGGGFIPVGSKEKADDVPARLSKNEFVMTADAVRAAGGGSVNKGAQRMYQLMNQLEAKV